MKIRILPAGILALALVAGAASASPEFMSYEGRNSIHEGQGGERKTVEAVDFWMRGDPPRRYQVIGSLTNERHKSGVWGAIRMSSLDTDIAKAAKAAGGDAVILDAQGDEVTGVVSDDYENLSGNNGGGMFNANAFGGGSKRAIKEHNSRYLVIKYLPEASIPPPTTTPSAASPIP